MEKVYKQPLTERQATEIRKKYDAGGYSQHTLGLEYGVTGQSIGQILRGLTHVSTLVDKDGWPLYNRDNQIGVLRARVTKLESAVARLRYELFAVKVKTGILPAGSKPDFGYDVSSEKRYVAGLDTWTKEYIDIGVELDMEDRENDPTS